MFGLEELSALKKTSVISFKPSESRAVTANRTTRLPLLGRINVSGADRPNNSGLELLRVMTIDDRSVLLGSSCALWATTSTLYSPTSDRGIVKENCFRNIAVSLSRLALPRPMVPEANGVDEPGL